MTKLFKTVSNAASLVAPQLFRSASRRNSPWLTTLISGAIDLVGQGKRRVQVLAQPIPSQESQDDICVKEKNGGGHSLARGNRSMS